MTFDEILEQVITLLQRQGRVSYRALKRRFGIDDDYIDDLKEEIIHAQRLGDFSKRISLIRPLKLDGSEYPTWATQDGAPIGSRPPASLSCQVLSPSHTLCGSTPPPDAVP